jgi:DNA-directed RNA polymerase specialized sigma subunit
MQPPIKFRIHVRQTEDPFQLQLPFEETPPNENLIHKIKIKINNPRQWKDYTCEQLEIQTKPKPRLTIIKVDGTKFAGRKIYIGDNLPVTEVARQHFKSPKAWGLPSSEEQLRLLAIIKNPASTKRAVAEAKDDLTRGFINYVADIAKGIFHKGHLIKSSDLEDITAAGWIGYLEAINDWNPRFGKPLTNLASLRIKYACMRERDQIIQRNYPFSIPDKIIKTINKVRRIREEEPSQIKKLCFTANHRDSTRQIILFAAQGSSNNTISLDAPIQGTDENTSLTDNFRDGNTRTPSIYGEISDIMRVCRAAISKMDPRERAVHFCRHPGAPVNPDDLTPITSDDGTIISVDRIISISHFKNNASILAAALKKTPERIRQIGQEINRLFKDLLTEQGIDASCLAAFNE